MDLAITHNSFYDHCVMSGTMQLNRVHGPCDAIACVWRPSLLSQSRDSSRAAHTTTSITAYWYCMHKNEHVCELVFFYFFHFYHHHFIRIRTISSAILFYITRLNSIFFCYQSAVEPVSFFSLFWFLAFMMMMTHRNKDTNGFLFLYQCQRKNMKWEGQRNGLQKIKKKVNCNKSSRVSNSTCCVFVFTESLSI